MNHEVVLHNLLEKDSGKPPHELPFGNKWRVLKLEFHVHNVKCTLIEIKIENVSLKGQDNKLNPESRHEIYKKRSIFSLYTSFS